MMKVVLMVCLVSFHIDSVSSVLAESDRIAEYQRRGYSWPPPFELYQPATDGWVNLQTKRFDQVWKIPDRGNRYDGWMQSVTSAYVQPNFTENGWGLTRAPQHLVDDLRHHVRHNYEVGNYDSEGSIEVIDGDQPIFIKGKELADRVLRELQPIHEAWGNIPLEPWLAYGFRLYKNNSSLLMHVDKPTTHIISCILHIDSSDDAEPWPILIEDYHGNTNEVILTPGDMLLYESSKCFHGRPQNFRGTWYSSIFVHYYPAASDWNQPDRGMEGHYAVPPGWSDDTKWPSSLPKLEIRGTSMREPECYPRNWCAETVQFHGPGEEGIVLSTGGTRTPLFDDGDMDEF